jgi:hypothetical protein
MTHLSPGNKSSQMLAYLKQRDILGEIGMAEYSLSYIAAIFRTGG